MNISLPPSLKDWVEEQRERGGFATASEYVRQLIREEQQRQARLAVEAKLEEAIDSGPAEPVTARTWSASEKRVEKRLQAGSRKQPSNGTKPR